MAAQTSSLTHIGFILDGNRRWAKEQGLPTLEGHQKGAEVFKEIAMAAFDRGALYVSAYVFSNENWKRTQKEVSYLMRLVPKAIEQYLVEFHKKGVRLVIIGSRKGLDKKVLAAVDKAEEVTKNNTKGTLGLCFNYGGHEEIIDAVKAVPTSKIKDLTPDSFEQYLYSKDFPDLDLIVRTSGEQRLSGFMLWRAIYAEMIFVKKHFPAFTVKDLDDVVDEFKARKRRFGG